MTVAEKMCKVASTKYSNRLREISKILSETDHYEVKRLGNSASVRNQVLRYTRDMDGYRHIENNILPLAGAVSLVPQFRIHGDFAVILVRARMINPVNKSILDIKTIFIYEKEEDVSSILGGVFGCLPTR